MKYLLVCERSREQNLVIYKRRKITNCLDTKLEISIAPDELVAHKPL